MKEDRRKGEKLTPDLTDPMLGCELWNLASPINDENWGAYAKSAMGDASAGG